MTKLEQLHLFLRFHFAPDSPEKREVWETCCLYEYSEANVAKVCRDIFDGVPGLSEFEEKMLRIIAEPSPPDDSMWAEKITNALETADIQWEIISLLLLLGYTKTAEAWRERAV